MRATGEGVRKMQGCVFPLWNCDDSMNERGPFVKFQLRFCAPSAAHHAPWRPAYRGTKLCRACSPETGTLFQASNKQVGSSLRLFSSTSTMADNTIVPDVDDAVRATGRRVA